MGRRSEDSDSSSVDRKKHKKKSSKKSRDVSRSRSRERSKKKKKVRRRSRSRSRDRRRSRSRSSRDRRRSRSRDSRSKSRDRSRDRKRSRRRSRHRSREKYVSRDRSASRDRTRTPSRAGSVEVTSRDVSGRNSGESSPGEPQKITKRQDEIDITVADKLKRERAILGIESESFVQQDFRSSHNKLINQKEGNEFDFGTSAEKTSKTEAESKLEKLNKQGMFHPELFKDQKKREEKFIKNLYEMRQQALKVMK